MGLPGEKEISKVRRQRFEDFYIPAEWGNTLLGAEREFVLFASGLGATFCTVCSRVFGQNGRGRGNTGLEGELTIRISGTPRACRRGGTDEFQIAENFYRIWREAEQGYNPG